MKRVHQVAITVAVVCAVVLIVAVLAWKPISTWWQWRHHTKPDVETRMAVSGLKPAQIDSIQMNSPYTPTPWRDIVRDRPAIRLLLAGLKDAHVPDPMRENRAETVVIRLRNGKSIGPFYFSTDRPIDAFSPTFIEGLKAIKMRLPRWD